jgi:predicted  nucleic acid-binding Zn-ribbon protein
VAGLEAHLSELNPKLSEMIAEEEDRILEISNKVAAIKSEREAIADSIEGNLLKRYEQVRKAKKGTAIAVVNDSRCGGCNVKLPINIIQKLKKAQEVITCPSCGRILWAK